MSIFKHVVSTDSSDGPRKHEEKVMYFENSFAIRGINSVMKRNQVKQF